MKGFSNIRWFSREQVCNEIALNFSAVTNYVEKLLADEIGDALPKKMNEILKTRAANLELELACNLDLQPILKACYSLEGDGLAVLLAYNKLFSLLQWGDSIGERADTLPNVAALLRSKVKIEPGVKVKEYFADVTPPQWFKGEVVSPRREGLITVKYSDGSKIDQEEREVRQWVDVLDWPEWKSMVISAKGAIAYLRNRLHGNLPANQKHYDCSHMFQVLKVVQAFNPSWAARNLTADVVDRMRIVAPLSAFVTDLHEEIHTYLAAAANATIDHTENADDHSFTRDVLNFFRDHGSEFPAWASAARVVFAFTPNSAAAERVFSLLNSMYTKNQIASLADGIQAAIMLKYNKRELD
ncbi:hypothetical protein AB1Y20_015507 [Prymnesium parvum]|uniref:HAT C-terminal dimerisation domain-containing protein n=1 Tax=Prymnesium parvum TaxID=97485 RepID=A0AB34JY36_PRYPA